MLRDQLKKLCESVLIITIMKLKGYGIVSQLCAEIC
jgi:hypothetical protein